MLDAEFQGSYPCNFFELYESWPYSEGTHDKTVNDASDARFETLLGRLLAMHIQQMMPCARIDAERTATTTSSVSTKDAPLLTPNQILELVTELKRLCNTEIPRLGHLTKLSPKDGLEAKKNNERKFSRYEVFLGGSCNPTTWRQEIAIPALKKHSITYYNPQVSHWAPELVEEEHKAKQTAAVLFFVIDRQTRSVASIVEAAYLAASRGKLILVIVPLEGPGQLVSGDPISQQEFEDLSTGQQILKDLVERMNIPVYSSVPKALECTAKVCIASRKFKEQYFPEEALSRIALFYNEQSPVSNDKVTESSNDSSKTQSSSESFVDKAAALLWSLLLPVHHLPGLSCYPKNHSSCDGYSPDLVLGGAKDVYLGGSCGSSTWRERIAIPLIKKHGLSYFNPKMSNWEQRLLPTEAAAIDSSRVLLFVITSETRSLSAMALAAHYIGQRLNVVLCVQQLLDNCEIQGEKLTRTAVKDYNRGRSYLTDIAKREGVPVFDDITEAVTCTIQRCKQQC